MSSSSVAALPPKSPLYRHLDFAQNALCCFPELSFPSNAVAVASEQQPDPEEEDPEEEEAEEGKGEGKDPEEESLEGPAPVRTNTVYFDKKRSETELEIAAAYEALYGQAYSGISVLGNDVDSVDKHKEKQGFRMTKKTDKIKDGFEERVVQVRRVTKVVKGGKQMSFRAVVIVGNKNGKVGVGVGMGKAKEVIAAVQKSARCLE